MTEQTGSLDRIEIRGLRLVATHGALLEEQERPQPFELDIDVDLLSPAMADGLEHTVDYGALVNAAAQVTQAHSFVLLESLAAALAERMISMDPRVLRAEVTVRKVRPPIPHDVSSVGVRVVRKRKEAGG